MEKTQQMKQDRSKMNTNAEKVNENMPKSRSVEKSINFEHKL